MTPTLRVAQHVREDRLPAKQVSEGKGKTEGGSHLGERLKREQGAKRAEPQQTLSKGTTETPPKKLLD